MTADSALHLFALRRTRAADTLDGLADAVDDLGGEVSRAADRLRTTAARAREGRFVVLLVGCFSSGKSTLLNALLGQPVLPVKVNPCTAILTELVYSDVPSVEVRFRDGRPPEVLTPEAFLQRYQLRTLTDEDAGAEVRDRFGAVDRAVVSWPLPLLRNGVVLIDTPGLDDDDVRTARTLASLPDADAVIFVLAATRFLTDLERRTLRRELLPLGLTNLFFPVTMVDLVDALSDNPERDLLALNQQAQEALGPLCQVNDKDRFDQRFFPLNARGGLHARWDRAAQQRRTEPHVAELESTGLAAFEDHLERFLVSERGNAQLMHLVGQATLAHDVVARQAAMDEATASASVEDLRERAEKLQPRFSELETIADRVADSVDHFIVRQQNAVWHSLRGFLAETEDLLEDAINGFDLGTVPGFDLLTTRGRKRVEQALQEQLESWLDERVQEWQNSLRPHLEGALHGLRQELAADAQDFDALAREIVTDFAGGTLELPYSSGLGEDPDPIERWFSVALGAALLSPRTMAAGWSEGYQGALQGAAGRIAVRLTLYAIAALLGPVAWTGLVLYAISDAALLVITGGGQLRRLRKAVAQNLRGKLVAQADEVKGSLSERVGEGLLPIRDGLLSAARGEADELRALLDETIAAREQAVFDAAERKVTWQAALKAFEVGLAELRRTVDE